MPVAPSGHLSLPLSYLRATVAGSASFRVWVGVDADDAAGALARVYPFQTGAATVRPFAVVEWARSYTRKRRAGGSRNWFEASGALLLTFRETLTEADPADAGFAFGNQVGAIIEEMEELAGTAGYLDIQESRLVEGPWRPEEDEVKAIGYDFFQCSWEVEFSAP